MPIYTYLCPTCSNRFELRQGWDAEAVAPCPTCQTEAKRVLVVPSVIFKGKGWYSTDSKRSSHAGLVGSGGEGGGDGDGGDRGGSGGSGGSSEGAPSAAASEPKAAATATD